MLWSVLFALALVLLGFYVGWLGMREAQTDRAGVYDRDRHPRRRWSPLQERPWLIGSFMIGGLGLVCFGLTILRQPNGPSIMVPASDAFFDQALGVLTIVCLSGSFVLGGVWAIGHTVHGVRSQRQRSGDS